MKLYELATEFQELVKLAETGDEADAQAFADSLEGLQGELEQKFDNCCAVYKTITAERDALTDEARRLSARSQSLNASSERLHSYIQNAMKTAGLKKIKGQLFTATIQNNAPSVVLDVEDAALLPEEFRRVKIEANKSAIGAVLKSGEPLPFAHLEHTESLRIR